MTATEILGELERRGVKLQAAGDRLRFRPVGAVPDDLRDALVQHKAELLALVRQPVTGFGLCPGPDNCAGCYRIGVVDGPERFIHPPKGKRIHWTAWKPATEKVRTEVELPLQKPSGPHFVEKVQVRDLPGHVAMRIEETIERDGNPDAVFGWYAGALEGAGVLNDSALAQIKKLSSGFSRADNKRGYFEERIRPFLDSMRTTKR